MPNVNNKAKCSDSSPLNNAAKCSIINPVSNVIMPHSKM